MNELKSVGGEPTFSVVIPTRSIPPHFDRLLACLAAQTLPPGQFEVIIVSGAEAGEVLQHVPAGLPFALRVLSVPGPGPSRKRNAGADAARGRLLVFQDDDMAPTPELLAAYLQAHGADDDRVVMGYTPRQVSDRRPDWLDGELCKWWEVEYQEMAEPGHRFDYTDVLSGNFSLPSELFRRIGGFDLSYFPADDYELGVRLLKEGARLGYCPAARSDHHDRSDMARMMTRMTTTGTMLVKLMRQYPELATNLPVGRLFADTTLRGRLIKTVAWRWPAGGSKLQVLAERLTYRFESTGIYTLWSSAYGAGIALGLWEGLRQAAGSIAELERLLHPAASVSSASTQMYEADLAGGLTLAAAELDRCRPTGARITWNGLPLGELPAIACAEPLAGRHLHAWVEGPGAQPLARMLALAAALGLEGVQPELCTAATSLRELPPPWPRTDMTATHVEPAEAQPLDLDEGLVNLHRLTGTHEPLALLVRRHGAPLGWVHISATRSPRTIADLLYCLLAQLDNRLLLPKPRACAGKSASLPPVSVVICTSGHAEHLQGCLDALACQQHAPAEVIVVDNGSPSDNLVRIAAAAGVQYVREDQLNLSQARNRGLRATSSPIVACLDGDARPAADWLLTLARSLAGEPAAGQLIITAQPTHTTLVSQSAA